MCRRRRIIAINDPCNKSQKVLHMSNAKAIFFHITLNKHAHLAFIYLLHYQRAPTIYSIDLAYDSFCIHCRCHKCLIELV